MLNHDLAVQVLTREKYSIELQIFELEFISNLEIGRIGILQLKNDLKRLDETIQFLLFHQQKIKNNE